jgi:cobalt-zinc-cadmium efflux system protein
MAHHHGHADGASGAARDTPPDQVRARSRALWIALGANGGFLVVQVLAGIAFGSLALIADSAHMASDVMALVVALIAQRLVLRPPSVRHTYGMLRAEVVAAQLNAVVLIAVSAWVIYEAIERFSSPSDVDALGVIVVGALGLLVNAVSAWVIRRASGSNLNMRGAFLHLASDAAGSLGVVIAGVVIAATGEDWVDPLTSILITVLVLVATVQLLRDATRVLLEGAPQGLDVDAVERSLADAPEVQAVHHLHVWSIGSETPALSAHVVLAGAQTLHDAQVIGDRLKQTLAAEFGIEHATLELECHDCDTEPHDVPPGTSTPGRSFHSHA